MIRFQCPGCQATYTVGDEKAGKQGKCPKCQSGFVIPEAETGFAPPPPTPMSAPPPPVPAQDDGIEIAPCPKCGTRLTVSHADIGLNVQCPTCATIFTATRPNHVASSSRSIIPAPRQVDDEDEDEEEERPLKRPRRAKRRRQSPLVTDAFAGFFLCRLYLSPWILPAIFWIVFIYETVAWGRHLYEFFQIPKAVTSNWTNEQYFLVLGLIFFRPITIILTTRISCEVIIAILGAHETLVEIRNQK